MFGKKSTATSFSAGATTLISKGTEVIGDIRFSGNLMIEGVVRGNVYAEEGVDAQARVLNKGLVEGEISVPTLVINGTVKGDVYSSKHIELAAKAIVDGNVHYTSIEMVKGAQVNGNLLYTETSKKKSEQSAVKPADSSAGLSVASGE